MQPSISLNRAGAALALLLSACSLESAPTPCSPEDRGCTRAALTNQDAGPDASTDASMVVELRNDGETCEQGAQCKSAHCNGGLCCSGGNCCLAAADCPATGGVGMACDNAATCQGTRGAVVCENFRCGTMNGVPDDSACTGTMEANACGAYRPVFCNGRADQQAPMCPTTCRRDSDCDPGAHCNGTCVADAANGAQCSADSDCASGHCANGACCASGDCCRAATDCPSSYTTAAECDSTATCQGSRTEAACVNDSCVSTRVDDDSACNASVRAMVCGVNLDVFCSGLVVQIAPTCGSGCSTDADCVSSAHCSGGMCITDLPNGSSCNGPGDCASGYCQNNVCCGSGSCCQTANDCGAFAVRQCDQPNQCQGYRQDAVCSNFQCSTSATRVDDDSACGSSQSASCGDYADMTCTGAASQPTCLTSCSNSADCDAGLICTANACAAPPPTGG